MERYNKLKLLKKLKLLQRDKLSRKYLIGKGIEIGALHYPLKVSEYAYVLYIDHFNNDLLRLHYPELKDHELVNVDIIDDGEKLEKIGNASLDFIIANHMLEHCENPIETINNHLSKLVDGGILYYSIPDKRLTFDINRAYTSFDHLLSDYKYGSEISRKEHYYEWVKYTCNIIAPDEIESNVNKLLKMHQSIHFHVWDIYSFYNFLINSKKYLSYNYTIIYYDQNFNEVIAIMKKVEDNIPQVNKKDHFYAWCNYSIPEKAKVNEIITMIKIMLNKLLIKYLRCFFKFPYGMI